MNTFKFALLLVNILFVRFNLVNCDGTSASAPGSEELEDARLLVAKNILNNFIVEGSDIEIRYNIYNIGNS